MRREQQEILGGVQEEASKDTKREQESRGGKEEKEAWQGERIDFISCIHYYGQTTRQFIYATL